MSSCRSYRHGSLVLLALTLAGLAWSVTPSSSAPAAPHAAARFEYRFDASAEGWGGIFEARGGNPGGHLCAVAPTFSVPQNTLSAFAGSYGETLSFDLKGISGHVPSLFIMSEESQRHDLQLLLPALGAGWKRYTVRLDTSTAWQGTLRPSAAEIREILDNLTHFGISSEDRSSGPGAAGGAPQEPTLCIDNVRLGPAARQEPKIVVSPTRLRFPRVRAEGSHTWRKAAVTRNVGRVTASGEIALNDPHLQYRLRVGDVEQSGGVPVPYTLRRGRSLRFQVIFDPTAAGAHAAALEVTNPGSSRHPRIQIPISGRAR